MTLGDFRGASRIWQVIGFKPLFNPLGSLGKECFLLWKQDSTSLIWVQAYKWVQTLSALCTYVNVCVLGEGGGGVYVHLCCSACVQPTKRYVPSEPCLCYITTPATPPTVRHCCCQRGRGEETACTILWFRTVHLNKMWNGFQRVSSVCIRTYFPS